MDEKMGERLLAYRKSLGLTQEQLAEMVGVSRATIWAIETGKSIPNGYTMFQIAKALGVSVTDIFAEEEKPSKVKRETIYKKLEEILEEGK